MNPKINNKLAITVLLAAKNEELNISKCLESLRPAEKIYVLDSKSYSSQFYTQGKIQLIKVNQLKNIMASKKPFYIIISNKRFRLLNFTLIKKFRQIGSNKKRGVYEFDPSIMN